MLECTHFAFMCCKILQKFWELRTAAWNRGVRMNKGVGGEPICQAFPAEDKRASRLKLDWTYHELNLFSLSSARNSERELRRGVTLALAVLSRLT